MYNAGNTTNPAAPTSPSTPVSTPANNGPPAATTASQQDTPSQPPTAPQTPTPAPAPTPPQPQPKKNLSLTVRGTKYFSNLSKLAGQLPPADWSVCCVSPHREIRCTQPRRCSRRPTKSPDQRRLSFWASWLDPEVGGPKYSSFQSPN